MQCGWCAWSCEINLALPSPSFLSPTNSGPSSVTMTLHQLRSTYFSHLLPMTTTWFSVHIICPPDDALAASLVTPLKLASYSPSFTYTAVIFLKRNQPYCPHHPWGL